MIFDLIIFDLNQVDVDEALAGGTDTSTTATEATNTAKDSANGSNDNSTNKQINKSEPEVLPLKCNDIINREMKKFFNVGNRICSEQKRVYLFIFLFQALGES